MPRRPKRPPNPPPTYQVFVSHATADKGVALLLCDKIDAIRGVSTFRDDRDIDGGEAIPVKLRQVIHQSDEMLVLLTQTSVQRAWVQNEIGAMWVLGKLIVPVFHLIDPAQFPPLVRDVKAYRLDEFERDLADLRERATGGKG